MPRASIDIGSNTLHLFIVDDQGTTLTDRGAAVGLGAGLGDRGLFRPDRMEAALEVLTAFTLEARSHGILARDVSAVATSAARRALNAKTFFARVQDETGLAVRIITGSEEARLTWLGAIGGLSLPSGPVGVVDLGAGSTEVVFGEQGVLSSAVSFPLGSVRLTEAHFGPAPDRYRPADLARLRAAIAAELEAVAWTVAPRALVASAGTALTLAAMEAGQRNWDATGLHGMRLTRGALRRWTDRLLAAGAAERRELAAVAPDRADVLLAGACVLEAVCTAARRDSLLISDGGVRHGLLAESSA